MRRRLQVRKYFAGYLEVDSFEFMNVGKREWCSLCTAPLTNHRILVELLPSIFQITFALS